MHRLQPNVDTWHHGKVHRVSLRRHDYLFILFLFVTDIRTLRVWFRAKSVERNSKRNGHWQHMSLASIDRSMQLHTNQSQYINPNLKRWSINWNTFIWIRPSIFTIYSFILYCVCFYSDIKMVFFVLFLVLLRLFFVPSSHRKWMIEPFERTKDE